MIKKEFLESVLNVQLDEKAVDPQLLNNDHLNYQRRRIESRVMEIIYQNIPPVSYPIVAVRPDNSHWIINGQHHVEADVRRDHAITIYFFPSEGPEYEAVIFQRFQKWQHRNDN